MESLEQPSIIGVALHKLVALPSELQHLTELHSLDIGSNKELTTRMDKLSLIS